MSYFMKTIELCSTSTTMNTDTLSEYVKKRKNMIYTQHQIMITEHIASEKCQQDTDILTTIKITQHELQNVTREKNI